jgi:predicted metal-dependent phosphoesterase TrpH
MDISKENIMGLADLHIHTNHSYDGTATVPDVLRKAKQLGLDVIAITDHDEITGALEAMRVATHFGVEVIPGIEITTAEGDLLAFFITEKVTPGLSLIDTVLKVRELGGVCVAAHPMSGGLGMKSLSAYSIIKALRNPQVAQTLIGIETYNGTAIDRISNHSVRILASRLHIAQTGSSDAHIIDTIGFGVTEFKGHRACDLLQALKEGTTKARKQKEWSPLRILGSWGMRYLGSMLTRWVWTTG